MIDKLFLSSIFYTAVLLFENDRIVEEIFKIGNLSSQTFYFGTPFETTIITAGKSESRKFKKPDINYIIYII